MSSENISISGLIVSALTSIRKGFRGASFAPVVVACSLAGVLVLSGFLILPKGDGNARTALGCVVLGLTLPSIALAYRISVLQAETDRMKSKKEALIRADLLWHDEMLQARRRHFRENGKMLKDLHDTVGGISTNIGMLAEVARGLRDPEEVRKTLAVIAALSRENIDEVRSFMQSLDAQELNWRSFMAELMSHGFAVTEPHDISFSFEAPKPGDRLPPLDSHLYLNILRTYKEALTNVVKHAGARNVTVEMRVAEDLVTLDIRDDGRGLPESLAKGRGLTNMRTRAEELGGTFTIVSDMGARIGVAIPLPIKSLEQGIPR
jgi:signal transduction histidine kinase